MGAQRLGSRMRYKTSMRLHLIRLWSDDVGSIASQCYKLYEMAEQNSNPSSFTRNTLQSDGIQCKKAKQGYTTGETLLRPDSGGTFPTNQTTYPLAKISPSM